ncbi:uncharacterized protein BDR25DRAFT_100895 [Lindgomyces ingoldianus]|uniref:Uncharacterized protein n=1 Tax=Lindgomyces ingoldianus TaxID=673940 RepID=A0ACB6R7I1_9PLEO|nr:uncharacterized protein BDR25DRAFT_100895 [Lindgomyces ingoldianus]KAF2475214.1 hypothetical protein BDR25DRAFT_100895 [Lindgomyces ingoldianus]
MVSGFEDWAQIADASTHIQKLPFLITSGLFFTIALLSASGRVLLKLRYHRPFNLDDCILFLGTACLIAGTGIMYALINDIYLGMALAAVPTLSQRLPMSQLLSLVSRSMAYIDSFQCLCWTAIFAVKFAFLAFFWKTVERTVGLRRYYWGVVVVMACAWVYLVVNPFLACPYFGIEASTKCSGPKKDRLYITLSYTGTVIDCVTDFLIVTIPVLVLHRVRITLRQKLAVGTFMSLSIVMIIISIVRAAVLFNPQGEIRDGPLQTYLTHVEACVAVIMVSLTAFRSLFNLEKEEKRRLERLKWSPGT